MKLLARFLEDPSNAELVLMQLNEWLSDFSAASNKTLQTIAATIFTSTDNINEAFRVLGEGSNSEQLAMLVQLHLRINRLDLAQNILKKLKAADEDSALAMMTTAWTHIYSVRIYRVTHVLSAYLNVQYDVGDFLGQGTGSGLFL